MTPTTTTATPGAAATARTEAETPMAAITPPAVRATARAPRPRVRTTRVRATGTARTGIRPVAPPRVSERAAARAGREFVLVSARRAAENGVRQFLDVGSVPGAGPGAYALHRVVQEAAAGARLVCCDRDPLAHARAALDGAAPDNSAPEDTLALVHAGLGDAERILDAPGLSDTIDLGHPVALSVSAVPGGPAPYEAVQTLLSALPAGSLLVLTLTTADFREAARFFDGLEPDAAGVVPLPGGGYAGVGRKP